MINFYFIHFKFPFWSKLIINHSIPFCNIDILIHKTFSKLSWFASHQYFLKPEEWLALSPSKEPYCFNTMPSIFSPSLKKSHRIELSIWIIDFYFPVESPRSIQNFKSNSTISSINKNSTNKKYGKKSSFNLIWLTWSLWLALLSYFFLVKPTL